LFVAASSAFAADHLPADLFPPKTRVVMGIAVRTLLDSPLLERAISEAVIPAGSFAGIDPLKDIDSVFVASEGQDENSPTIVVLRGRFQSPANPAKQHNGVAILEHKKTVVAMLDSNTALIGSLADVRAAIDRRGGPSNIPAALAARAAALSAGNDFWAVGDLPDGIRSENPTAKQFASMDRFDFAASLRDGLRIHGAIHLRSAEDAAQLASTLRLFEAMMQAQQSKSGAKLDLKADRGTLSVNLSVPEAELKRALATQRTSLAAALKARMEGTAATPEGPKFSPSRAPEAPATIVSNDRGETLQVMLPVK
jgi:hypothetical protein